MKLTCPHCGLDAMAAWRKLALGPVATSNCRRCGLKVSTAVPQAIAAFTPTLVAVAIVLSGLVRGASLLIAIGAIGWLVTCWLYLVWVPLVPRQVTRREAVLAAQAATGRAEADGG
ncbi:hypothetical protein [Rhizobacter sp. LjRoot28]|uniref:hypothetical protein n=1 Tax=Rhizobacter sp. LjRoot28 TaxID=3342309 RepID=UPI003ECF6AB9